ncbi:MAG TPA: SUMF1/EgtB/PvdO family nonheme iron enzyme [Xanthomonadaceae bacterium]|nr:SUMF1/EgtB/PvdO family nonheme iron enzyme [Xanthomonadaceae bacterium]
MRGPALPAGFPVTAHRVVRGGAWNNNQTHARAACRNDNAPDNRDNNIGFRLARASPIRGHWSVIAARMTFPL